jgi:hypothetical protein
VTALAGGVTANAAWREPAFACRAVLALAALAAALEGLRTLAMLTGRSAIRVGAAACRADPVATGFTALVLAKRVERPCPVDLPTEYLADR